MKPDACLSGLLALHFSKVPSSKKEKFLALRLHVLSLLSKEAKKLRLSQAQAKKLVKKLRLRLLPCDSVSDFSPVTPVS
jgi:hypothetical protein